VADLDHLRVCCDFMNYLFHMDDLSDDMDKVGNVGMCNDVMNSLYHPYSYEPVTRLGKMTAEYVLLTSPFVVSFTEFRFSFWKRFIKTSSPGAQQRFMSTMDQWFHSITIEGINRKDGTIPDLETYIMERRNSTACKPSWALIEYANNLDIPDNVMEHGIIRNLEDAANDVIAWFNVGCLTQSWFRKSDVYLDLTFSCRMSVPIDVKKERVIHIT
jgi:Terpene synthase family 2, C-terminal metal binding